MNAREKDEPPRRVALRNAAGRFVGRIYCDYSRGHLETSESRAAPFGPSDRSRDKALLELILPRTEIAASRLGSIRNSLVLL